MRENLRTNMRAMSIPVFGVNLWNSLNISLISITSTYIFKYNYVNILLSKFIDIKASKSLLCIRVYSKYNCMIITNT